MLCAAALLLIVQNMILTVIIVTLLPISFFLYIKACETTTFRDTNVFKNDDFVDKKFNGIIRDNYFNADYLFKNAKSYSVLIMYLLLACSEFMVLSMNLESDDTLFVRFGKFYQHSIFLRSFANGYLLLYQADTEFARRS